MVCWNHRHTRGVSTLCCNGEKSRSGWWSHLLINAKCSFWHEAGDPMCSLFPLWGMTPAQSQGSDSQEGQQVPQSISGMWHSGLLPPKASGYAGVWYYCHILFKKQFEKARPAYVLWNRICYFINSSLVCCGKVCKWSTMGFSWHVFLMFETVSKKNHIVSFPLHSCFFIFFKANANNPTITSEWICTFCTQFVWVFVKSKI